MKIQIEDSGPSPIIHISGRIDTLNAGQLEAELLPLITQSCPSITINCENVDYISSTGLRVFILANKKTQSFNESVTITGLSNFLKEVFDVSGLTDLFTFV